MQITVKNWLNEWLEVYVKPCRKENTYQCYKFIIIMILKKRNDLCKLGLADIDELYLQKMLNECTASYSKSTLKKMRIVFNSAYNAAVRNHKCKSNPASALIILDASEKEVHALTREEEEKVKKAANNDILGHLAIFMLDTGLRACELRNLKWSDYDRNLGEIYIRKSKTKNGIRIVPLISTAKNIIDSQEHICDYIFTSTIKRPVSKTVLRKLYDRLRKETGIASVTNHIYRHSFATRMVENKADYKALSKILGHRNVGFTMDTYADAESKFLHEQMSVLEDKPKRKVMRIKSMHIKQS